MKNPPVILDDDILDDAGKISESLNVPIDGYINDAVKFYNLYQHRKQLKKQQLGDSKQVRWGSMDVLSEGDRFLDEN